MQKKEILKFLTLIICINISLISFAQTPSKKFGKISKEALTNKVCSIDSSASAYYIFDYGNTYFEYGDTKVSSHDVPSTLVGYQTFFTRHLKIKILNKKGFSFSNFEIPLYELGANEKITNIKASTYNLENNEIVKSKLSRKDIFNEETSKHWTTKKFAMPGVKEGSIIEIEYTIKSDYSYLRPWYFQKTIPVLESEYQVKIPEYFHFNQTESGYFPIQIKTSHQANKVTITYHQKAEGYAVKEQTYRNTYNYKENVYHYSIKEVPAFYEEAYLKTADTYLSKIEYELQHTVFPNSTKKYYTTGWNVINEKLLSDKDFGEVLNNTTHLKKDTKELKQLYQTDDLLLNGAFNFIKNKFVWNGKKNKYTTSSLSNTYKSGGGNCADINLNLIALLQELGFAAYPVILSTQKHGIIHPSHPSMNRFNYVIAMVKIGEKTFLMDATDPYSGINLLPTRCLNGNGRIIHETDSDWISLINDKSYSMTETYQLEMNKDFSFDGVNQLILEDYAAYHYKKAIKKHNNITDYKTTLESENNDYTIDKIDVTGLDTTSQKLRLNINFTQKNYIEESNNIAFFRPVYQPFISKNPFQLDERNYPVEFNYPYKIKQVYFINIPKGFSVAEMPESLVARTPDSSMKYIYNITQSGNRITVIVQFSVNKLLFLPEEYQALKEFYQMMIDKQNELIVFKKEE